MCVQKTTFFERFQGRLKEAHLIFKNSNRWRTSNIMDIFNYHSSKVKVRAQQNVPGSENALNFAIFDVNENPCNAYLFPFSFRGHSYMTSWPRRGRGSPKSTIINLYSKKGDQGGGQKWWKKQWHHMWIVNAPFLQMYSWTYTIVYLCQDRLGQSRGKK